MAILQTGAMVGSYRIEEMIGKGGMAEVYRALDTNLNVPRAIKIMSAQLVDDPQFIARFKREAQAIASLKHPNILPVQTYGEDKNLKLVYIVTSFLNGGSLAELLKKDGMLSLNETLKIVNQIGEALGYAHEFGIVHRDVKPANILIDLEGKEGKQRRHYYLSDFGIAKVLESNENLTGTGVGIGTPEYMSPEQGLGDPLDGRSDIYSLGILFYRLLTGRVPFTGSVPFKVIHQHVTEPLPLPSLFNTTLMPGLEEIILRATAKKPSERFTSMDEFLRTLQEIVKRETVQTVPGVTILSAQTTPLVMPDQKPANSVIVTTIVSPDSFSENIGVTAATINETTDQSPATVMPIISFPTQPSPQAYQTSTVVYEPATTNKRSFSKGVFAFAVLVLLVAVCSVLYIGRAFVPSDTQANQTPVLVIAATVTPVQTIQPTQSQTGQPGETPTPISQPAQTPKIVVQPQDTPTSTPQPTENSQPAVQPADNPTSTTQPDNTRQPTIQQGKTPTATPQSFPSATGIPQPTATPPPTSMSQPFPTATYLPPATIPSTNTPAPIPTEQSGKPKTNTPQPTQHSGQSPTNTPHSGRGTFY